MNKFTKTYNVQPNSAQREALARAFKATVTGELLQGNAVELTLNHYQDEKLIARLFVNGKHINSTVVGERGGLTLAS